MYYDLSITMFYVLVDAMFFQTIQQPVIAAYKVSAFWLCNKPLFLLSWQNTLDIIALKEHESDRPMPTRAYYPFCLSAE